MRPIKQRIISTAITVLLYSASCSSIAAQGCMQDTVSFNQEYSLKVSSAPYIIDQATIDRRVSLFNDCVLCSETDRCTLSPFSMKASEIVRLYMIAERIRSFKTEECKDKKCITGLWVILTMKDEKLSYFFQPAVFKGSSRGSHLDPLFELVAVENVYVYESDMFFATNRESGTKEYMDQIRIKRSRQPNEKYRKGNFRNGVGAPTSSWRGDTRQVFYSFQEILRFYRSKNMEEAPGNYYCRNIYANSYADTFNRETRSDRHGERVKHTVYITVDSDAGPQEAIATTSGAGADLAHVCPSVCSELTYPSDQKAEMFMLRKERQINLE